MIEPAQLHRLVVHPEVNESGLGAEPEVDLADRVGIGAVAPGPDQELARDAQPAHRVEVVDGALEEDVVPAAGVVAGDLDQVMTHPHMLCRRRVGDRVKADVDPVGYLVPGERREVANGQLPVGRRRQPVVVGDRLLEGAAHRRPVGGVLAHEVVERHLEAPGGGDAELQRATPAEDAVGRLAPGDVGRDRLQRRWPELGRRPLGLAEVGGTVHADVAVGPGLGRRPLDAVVAVDVLGPVGIEFTLRHETAAGVLDHDRVAAPRCLDRVEDEARDGQVLAVREPREQHRVGAVARREEDICPLVGAVAHRDENVEVDSTGAHQCSYALGFSD